MKSPSLSFISSLAVVVIAAGILSSCVSTGTGSATRCVPDQQQLESRIDQAWTARKEGRWTDVFNFTTADYRSSHKKEDFGSSNVTITGHTIKEISIPPDDPYQANVAIEFTINHLGIDFSFPIDEHWVFENCDWHLDVQEKNQAADAQKPSDS